MKKKATDVVCRENRKDGETFSDIIGYMVKYLLGLIG